MVASNAQVQVNASHAGTIPSGGATNSVCLDLIEPLEASVGFGQLGRKGSLGYENKSVTVKGSFYPRSLSTHPPARLVYELGGRFATFYCKVAINEDVPAGRSHAQFSVLADGRHVSVIPLVTAGEAPREIVADIRGAQRLELVVTTTSWEFCHAVWLDPRLDFNLSGPGTGTLVDCLGRTDITLPSTRLHAHRCIATVASTGFSDLLDDMLGSLVANGCCPDALIVVFLVGTDAASEDIARKYSAQLVRCRPLARVNATLKSLMYSLPHIVQAEQFLCLDADMLVLDDLRPVFATQEACPPGSILACREGNGYGYKDLGHSLRSVYGGHDLDIARMLPAPNDELSYPLVVNDGIFAGSREALLALDSLIRSIPQAVLWTDQRRDIAYRNQFVFNLALARLSCGVELDPVYNVQLNSNDAQFEIRNGRIRAFWCGRGARVLHFNGCGRHKYPKWRNLFTQIRDPLVGPTAPDSYSVFLEALRAWVGRHGMAGLAWTFYGTGDAFTARVADVVTMPQFALLHYLIRSNGAVRVLETGTGLGVSTACLASAVAHRRFSRVVTFDPNIRTEAEELWSSLPPAMGACIERRAEDSLAGMISARQRGESYDVALLDSLHTEEQVWEEFQIATTLVCKGGLILVHDVRLKTGTVEQALKHIESQGYGVVRLWIAESGVHEESNLGLAVIENRAPAIREQP
jgi:predicted O-methyltransferase YrrM